MAPLKPGVIAAIFRKDFISLWPLVLGAFLLPTCLVLDRMVDVAAIIKTLIAGIGILATSALVFGVFHQDVVSSLRHDWRTRPIGVVNLIVAKVIFLFVFLGLPIFAAQFARELLQDHTAGEALLFSLLTLTAAALVTIPVIFLALVTSSLIEALLTMFGFVILAVLSTIFLPRVGGTGGGAGWIIEMLAILLALVFAAGVAVLLFRRKASGLARLTYFVGVVLCGFGLSRTPGITSLAVALQQGLGVDAPQAEALTASFGSVCSARGQRTYLFKKGIEHHLYGTLAVSGQPAGWQVAVDHITTQYLDRNGKTTDRVWARAREAGPPSAEGNTWELEALSRPGAQGGKLRWTYALTLLEPVGAQSLAADGKRRYLPNFGYCSADSNGRGGINVQCFKPFSQPAAVSTEVIGKPQTFNLTSTSISYKPAILEGFGDTRQGSPRPHGLGKLSPPQVLRLTAYAARAHISRQSVTPLATGAAPSCASQSKADPATLPMSKLP